MDGYNYERVNVQSDLLQDHEKKELRIIKQAIAKSFIISGHVDPKLNEETKEMMEEWIRWIYRDEETDRKLVRERERPF